MVCGFDEVMTIFWPTNALVRVDLPAFGRPTKQAKPDLKASGVDDIADLSGAIGNVLREWRRRRSGGRRSTSTDVGTSVTTAAASRPFTPDDSAIATASCSAVRSTVSSATVQAAYVRPSESRTAAPSAARVRARAARASVTSLASSAERSDKKCS